MIVCIVLLGVLAVLTSVKAAPRKKRQILGVIVNGFLGEGYGTSDDSRQSVLNFNLSSLLGITGRGGYSGERHAEEYGRYQG